MVPQPGELVFIPLARPRRRELRRSLSALSLCVDEVVMTKFNLDSDVAAWLLEVERKNVILYFVTSMEKRTIYSREKAAQSVC